MRSYSYKLYLTPPDTSQIHCDIECIEYVPEDKKSPSSQDNLFVPLDVTDLPFESRYTEYLGSLSLKVDNRLEDGSCTWSINETDLLGAALELSNMSSQLIEEQETLSAIRPVKVTSKYNLNEIKIPENEFTEIEGRFVSLLQEFESRLWEDEIAFRDPTVNSLKG